MSRPPDGESLRGGDLFGNSRSSRLTYCRYFLGRQGCYNSIMAIDPRQIELTAEQQQALAEMAEQAGRPWPDVLQDVLRSYPIVRSQRPIAQSSRSFYEAMMEDGAIGVVTEELPHDLATNSMHLEGFGGDYETCTN
ncbi:MAG: hypothetical protein IID44_11760 [Planctomycetes bacterium]|nr:hypothetical protein [Planctomycetota bacterium]